jgi:hydrogenase-4 membrane subunit HyfE
MQAVEVLAATSVLVLAVGVLLARSPGAGVTLYALAAVPQAVLAMILAARGVPWLWLDAAAILAVKGLWAPRLLRRAVPPDPRLYGQQAAFSPAMLLCAVAAVTLLCLRVSGRIAGAAEGQALGLALAALLVGLSAAAIRSELWAQAAGILCGEAGLMTGIFVLAGGLPPVGETWALAEVLVLAAVFAVVTRRVHAHHGAATSRLLRGLRG